MALFRCRIHGENFPGIIIGESRPIGFYATRFIEADTSAEAENLALVVLKGDRTLNVSDEHRTKEAKVFFEEILEVPITTERIPNKGFTFYVMGT